MEEDPFKQYRASQTRKFNVIEQINPTFFSSVFVNQQQSEEESKKGQAR